MKWLSSLALLIVWIFLFAMQASAQSALPPPTSQLIGLPATPPVALMTASCLGYTCTFDASQSTGSLPLSYQFWWVTGGGTQASSAAQLAPTFVHSYGTNPGTVNAHVVITDATARTSSSALLVFTVPVAPATVTPTPTMTPTASPTPSPTVTPSPTATSTPTLVPTPLPTIQIPYQAMLTTISGPSYTDSDVLGVLTTDNSTAGIGLVLRYQNGMMYQGVLVNGLLAILREDGQAVGFKPVAIPLEAGTPYAMRFEAQGDNLRLKLGRAADPEPTDWDLTTIDGALAAGQDGSVAIVNSGGSAARLDVIGLAVTTP